jgi:hypothetical protein
VLPTQVGDTTLTVEEGYDLWSETSGVDSLRLLLLRFGKDRNDIRVARAHSDLGVYDGGLDLWAIRTDGVPAEALQREYQGLVMALDPQAEGPWEEYFPWTEIAGRSVMGSQGDPFFLFLYPKGEVMFVGTGTVAEGAEGVLAALP